MVGILQLQNILGLSCLMFCQWLARRVGEYAHDVQNRAARTIWRSSNLSVFARIDKRKYCNT